MIFVPALYFLQGVPVIVVQQLSVILFKKLGIANESIGLWTSLITWPWILKMFWSPWIERIGTKRSWILLTQLGIVLFLVLAASAVASTHFFALTLAAFMGVALLSATHDIAADGFYMLALSPKLQSLLVGIRSTAFRLAMLFGTGILVVWAGKLENQGIPVAQTWRTVLLGGAAIYGVIALYNAWAMPRPQDSPHSQSVHKKVFERYFTQPGIGSILFFILTYRLGESMLVKMSAPFLLDPSARGGLGFSTEQVGWILGNVGVIALTLGGILGGWMISRTSLKKVLLPMALLMHLPTLLYIWAAIALPSSALALATLTGIEQFSYGFGFAAYLVYLLQISARSETPTADYAISSGLMAVGAMGAGIASGYLQEFLGYLGLFICSSLAGALGIVAVIAVIRSREFDTSHRMAQPDGR